MPFALSLALSLNLFINSSDREKDDLILSAANSIEYR